MSYKIKEGVTIVEEDGELVVFDFTGEKFFGLDIVGSIIWGKLEENHNFDEISRYIGSLYNIPEEQVKKDVTSFVTSLIQKGLVIMK
ncbi:PqqD family protein [Psychrobacillus sp. INOP01]|uniref:PqqD family protein n=1 Tax=Psychrobacillus sp. INOP01 TaxID=2829187 RepID=UPI001BAD4210|nr:PqqD family protein [Psychrobacillus sp. INOP01]QUG43128.1 PqqD family protein [Psychrobacillus sp. INOP01]